MPIHRVDGRDPPVLGCHRSIQQAQDEHLLSGYMLERLSSLGRWPGIRG